MAQNYYFRHRERISRQRKAYYKLNQEIYKKKSRDYYHTHQAHCIKIQREYKLKNANKVRMWAKISRQMNPDAHKNRIIKCKYGITLQEYKKLCESQNNVCAICGTNPRKKTRWGTISTLLSIDHCHQTKIIRGLLCHQCNAGIGFFKHDTLRLQKAIDYLSRCPS